MHICRKHDTDFWDGTGLFIHTSQPSLICQTSLPPTHDTPTPPQILG
jgi:hypothetical protein